MLETEVRSIAVVRALALGDLICAVPALRALRSRFPGAHVTLIGLPWAYELVGRYRSYLDEHLAFPGFPGIPEMPFEAARTVGWLGAAQRRRFDLAIQLHGRGESINEFTALLGAGWTAGFVPYGSLPPTEGHATWVPYPEHGSEVDRLLALPAALDAPVDDRLEFPLYGRDRAEAVDVLRAAMSGDPGEAPYAVVHAGGSEPSRRWPADRFAAVADGLIERGFEVVLTGTPEEAEVVAAVAAAMTNDPVDVTGRTSLGGIAAIVAGARLVVTNDTGISHVAAAVGTPSVVVFMGSERDRWAPKDATRHVAIESTDPGAPPDIAAVAEAASQQLDRFGASAGGASAAAE